MNTGDGGTHGPGEWSRSWAVLAVILFAGMAAPFNVYKVPPLMPILMGAFDLSGEGAGFLMSVFSVSGLVISLPAGFVFQRLGFRATGLIAMACLTVGAGLGSICSTTAPLLATRFLEGIGVALVSVAAPAIVSIRFSGRSRAKALGIWSMYLPLGSAMIFGIAPFVGSRWGWQPVWLTGCLYALCAGMLYFLFVKPLPGEQSKEVRTAGLGAAQGAALRKVLANRDLWFFSLLYCSFGIVFSAILGWAPTYLFTVKHQSLAFSSQLAGLIPILGIVGAPLTGWMHGWIRSTKSLIVIPMALLALAGPCTLHVRTDLLLPFMVVVGLIAAFVPTSLFIVVAKVVHDSRLSGVAMGIIATGFSAGALVGPIIFGFALDRLGGWEAAFLLLLPLGLAGARAGGPARTAHRDTLYDRQLS